MEELYTELINAPRSKVDLSIDWINKYPIKAGVYAVYDNSKMIYVGETGNIRKRMNDLRYTMNHSLRRLLGERLFSSRQNYKKASSSNKYPSEIELELEKWMKENLKISYIVVNLGRKELEEKFTEENTQFLNKRTKRK